MEPVSLLGIVIYYAHEKAEWDDYWYTDDTPFRVTSHGRDFWLISNETSRSIWTDGHIVVKVDRGTEQAQPEASIWLALDPEDRPFFATCLEVGHGYVVQEYVPLKKDGFTTSEHKEFEEQAERLFSKYDFEWDWQGWAQFGVDRRTGLLCIHDYCGAEATGEHYFSTLTPERAA